MSSSADLIGRILTNASNATVTAVVTLSPSICQEGGKGTWQIACSNNMGAAGTLKWVKDGGVTGTGRDHNDKKVKFTVSKNS